MRAPRALAAMTAKAMLAALSSGTSAAHHTPSYTGQERIITQHPSLASVHLHLSLASVHLLFTTNNVQLLFLVQHAGYCSQNRAPQCCSAKCASRERSRQGPGLTKVTRQSGDKGGGRHAAQLRAGLLHGRVHGRLCASAQHRIPPTRRARPHTHARLTAHLQRELHSPFDEVLAFVDQVQVVLWAKWTCSLSADAPCLLAGGM